MAETCQCGLILLAAGASRRMGQPKQLLPIAGQPLVRHVAAQVIRGPVSPVVVVLGAAADQVAPTLSGLPVRVAVNPDWEEGLGSSIRAGLAATLAERPTLDAVIVALADQPGLPAGHLAALVERFRAGGGSIVASQVGTARVPPVLFARDWFPRLQELTGDAGARDLLREHAAATLVVPLPSNDDLDTPEDYARHVGGAPK